MERTISSDLFSESTVTTAKASLPLRVFANLMLWQRRLSSRHQLARLDARLLADAALTLFPQVRFIGGPDLEANDQFLVQWVEKVAVWIEEGRTPYVFLHTPDNVRAAEQAMRFHQQLMARLPGLPALFELDRGPQVEQLGLL